MSSVTANAKAAVQAAATLRGEEPDQRRAARVAKAWAHSGIAHWSASDWRELDAGAARPLFDAASTAAFYTGEPRLAQLQLRALDVLDALHIATTADAADMARSLFSTRDFAAARRLLETHPALDLPAPPVLEDLSESKTRWPTELAVVAGDGSRLQRRSVRWPQGAFILVIAHPNCHFSRSAIEALEHDPALRALFERHSRWLAPQDGTTDFSVFPAWNAAHPAMPIAIAHLRSEWPLVRDWQTPTFYFMQGQRVMASVVGWPREGRADALRRAASAIGLSVPMGPDLAPGDERPAK